MTEQHIGGKNPLSNCQNEKLIPEFSLLRKHITEIHGSPDAGKTKAILSYIRTLQREANISVLYMDTQNKLQNAGEAAKLDPSLTWFMFGTSFDSDTMASFAKSGIDLLVIDDIVPFGKSLWKIAENLDHIVRHSNMAVILINQLRNVLNHSTGEFIKQPYRFNAIEAYCHYAIDLDERQVKIINQDIELELDEEVKMFLP